MADEPLMTICCLSYGNYPELSRGLVESLSRIDRGRCRFRVGLNDACEESREVLAELSPELTVCGSPPYHKYPVMRRLFHDPPMRTPYVMWFDDDSRLAESVPLDFVHRIVDRLQFVHMIGHTLWCRLGGKQPQAIRKEPWFTGKPVVHRQPIRFCTGGWWAAQTEWIFRHQWPIASLEHRGGDVLTGVLFYQQGYRMQRYSEHVCISAAESGSVNSRRRRGFDQAPWGAL